MILKKNQANKQPKAITKMDENTTFVQKTNILPHTVSRFLLGQKNRLILTQRSICKFKPASFFIFVEMVKLKLHRWLKAWIEPKKKT